MGIRFSHCLTLWLFLFALQSFAQTDKASVTFYSIRHSAKQQLKDAVVPVGTIPFTGWLFDGDQKLAHAQRGRFMTFHLSAGEHRFTVPYHSNRPGTTPLLLKAESGQHYCFRLSAKYKSASILLPAAVVDSQIEQVDCQQAQKKRHSTRGSISNELIQQFAQNWKRLRAFQSRTDVGKDVLLAKRVNLVD